MSQQFGQQINSRLPDKLRGKVVLNEYQLDQQIGKGSFGYVYCGIKKSTSDKVVIKVIPKKLVDDYPELGYLIPNEINSIKKIQSPYIVRYYGHEETKQNYYIVMEYCEGGDLGERLKMEKKFGENTALEYFYQTVEAYAVINAHGILHRDIKLENIMFKNEQIKLVDFGFAKILDPEKINASNNLCETVLGSPVYMAPEVLEEKKYGVKAEIYSLGVLLYMMLQGKPPYVYPNMFNPDDVALAQLIKKQNCDMKGLSPNVEKLLRQLLCYDPNQRPTLNQLRAHEIFQNLLAINQPRGLGSLSIEFINKPIKEEEEEEEKQMVYPVQLQKQGDLNVSIYTESDQKNDNEEEVEAQRVKSQSKQMLERQCVQDLRENYEYELNQLIQIACSVFDLSRANACYVKNYQIGLGFMSKELYLRFTELKNALEANKNIFHLQQQHFNALIANNLYQNLKKQVLQNYFPAVQNHVQFFFSEEYFQQVNDAHALQIKLLRDDLLQEDQLNNFYVTKKIVLKDYYKQVQAHNRALSKKKINKDLLYKYLLIQTQVLAAIDTPAFFTKPDQDFVDLQNQLQAIRSQLSSVDQIEQWIKTKEPLVTH